MEDMLLPTRPRQSGWLERHFQIEKRGSTLRTEVVAGLVDFLANAYLLVLVPQMLSHGAPEIPKAVFVFGFGVTACGSSILTGLLSNLPIPAGCGIGCATFYAYSLASEANPGKAGTFASTVCLLSSTLMFVLALSGLSWRIFQLVPKSVKEAMPIGL